MTAEKPKPLELTVMSYTTTVWPKRERTRKRDAAIRNLHRIPLFTATNLDWEVAQRLQETGYSSVGSVLLAGGTSRERMLLAQRTGLAATELWRTVCILDLSRVSSLPVHMIPELIPLGIYSVGRLARMSAETLAMLLLNFGDDVLDAEACQPHHIDRWLEEARQLPLILD